MYGGGGGAPSIKRGHWRIKVFFQMGFRSTVVRKALRQGTFWGSTCADSSLDRTLFYKPAILSCVKIAFVIIKSCVNWDC